MLRINKLKIMMNLTEARWFCVYSRCDTSEIETCLEGPPLDKTTLSGKTIFQFLLVGYIIVSSRVYAQSVSSQIRLKVGVGVIPRHDSHGVTTDLEMTPGPNRGMRTVQN